MGETRNEADDLASTPVSREWFVLRDVFRLEACQGLYERAALHLLVGRQSSCDSRHSSATGLVAAGRRSAFLRSTTAFRQLNLIGRWALSTHCRHWTRYGQ